VPPALEVSLMDSTLAALSSRVGSIYGLEELHVIIQDAVNATLRGVRGIVESQVNRIMEAEKGGVVKEMVTRLLTEEVAQVTVQSAQTLMRRELGKIEENQRRLAEAIAAEEGASSRRFQEAAEARRALDAHLQRGEAAQERLLERVAAVERGLTELPGAITRLATVGAQVDRLQGLCNSASESLTGLQQRQKSHEHACAERHPTKVDVARLAADVRELAATQQAHGDAWLQAALQAYLPAQDLGKHFDEAEERMRAELQKEKKSLLVDLEQVGRMGQNRCNELEQNKITQENLSEAAQAERQARRALEETLRGELATLSRECAKKAAVEVALEAQRSERASMADTFGIALAKAEEQGATLRKLLESAGKEIDKSAEQFRTLVADVRAQHQDIGYLQEMTVRLKETVQDEKRRVESIFSQQHHNRTELNHLLQRTNDLDMMRTDVKGLLSGSSTTASSMEALQIEVGQWEGAIAAQSVLQKESAQLRSDLAALKEAFVHLEKQQALGLMNLRDLHSSWLAR